MSLEWLIVTRSLTSILLTPFSAIVPMRLRSSLTVSNLTSVKSERFA